VLCAALGVLLPAAALADRYSDCTQTRDQERQLRGCNAIIDRGGRENANNRYAAYGNRGWIYLRQGRYEEGIADLDRSLTFKPRAAWSFANRGWVYNHIGDYHRAIADLNEAVAIEPRNPEYLRIRSLVHLKSGDHDRALADLDKAIAINPRYGGALGVRGEVHREKGDYDRAFADLDRAIALDPKDSDALATRGEAYREKGDYNRAFADLDRAAALAPKDSDVLARRGLAYADKGDYGRAFADLDRAVALDPRNTGALVRRGLGYAAKGDYGRALAELDSATANDPFHAYARRKRDEVAALDAGAKQAAAAREREKAERQAKAAPVPKAERHDPAPPGAGGRRVALVVGIDRYDHLADGLQLKKAANDATAVGDTMRGLGWEVIRAENVGRVELLRQWTRFLNAVEPGGTAMLFFAGHGVEIGGVNYLIPRDVPRVGDGEEELLKGAALGLDTLLEGVRARKPAVSLVILDACRDNPFVTSRGRSLGGSRGLADVRAPSGTFIMYSAGAGQRAIDRLSDADPDANSIYTRHLLPRLRTPGLGIQEIAREVRREVMETAKGVGHDQVPAYYDEVVGNFCPAGCAPPASAGDKARLEALEAELARLRAGAAVPVKRPD
jgi:tetratricopeptide (TPR) repeat protein